MYGVEENRYSYMMRMDSSLDGGYFMVHSNAMNSTTVAKVNKGVEIIGGGMKVIGWNELLKRTKK